jgi:hypothetical protein
MTTVQGTASLPSQLESVLKESQLAGLDGLRANREHDDQHVHASYQDSFVRQHHPTHQRYGVRECYGAEKGPTNHNQEEGSDGSASRYFVERPFLKLKTRFKTTAAGAAP